MKSKKTKCTLKKKRKQKKFGTQMFQNSISLSVRQCQCHIISESS